jgi:hypothetical protein
MNKEHINWCRSLFDTIKDGGAWAVPRSGLIFRKEGKKLVLTQRLPGFTDEQQDSEFDAIVAHFDKAGIDVLDG